MNFKERKCQIINSNGDQLLIGNLQNGLYKLICDPSFCGNFPVHSEFCNLTIHDVKSDLSELDL